MLHKYDSACLSGYSRKKMQSAVVKKTLHSDVHWRPLKKIAINSNAPHWVHAQKNPLHCCSGFFIFKTSTGLRQRGVRLERVEQTDTGLAVAAIRSHRSQSGLTVSVCSRVSNECVVNRTERSLPFTLVRLLRA